MPDDEKWYWVDSVTMEKKVLPTPVGNWLMEIDEHGFAAVVDDESGDIVLAEEFLRRSLARDPSGERHVIEKLPGDKEKVWSLFDRQTQLRNLEVKVHVGPTAASHSLAAALLTWPRFGGFRFLWRCSSAALWCLRLLEWINVGPGHSGVLPAEFCSKIWCIWKFGVYDNSVFSYTPTFGFDLVYTKTRCFRIHQIRGGYFFLWLARHPTPGLAFESTHSCGRESFHGPCRDGPGHFEGCGGWTSELPTSALVEAALDQGDPCWVETKGTIPNRSSQVVDDEGQHDRCRYTLERTR